MHVFGDGECAPPVDPGRQLWGNLRAQMLTAGANAHGHAVAAAHRDEEPPQRVAQGRDHLLTVTRGAQAGVWCRIVLRIPAIGSVDGAQHEQSRTS